MNKISQEVAVAVPQENNAKPERIVTLTTRWKATIDPTNSQRVVLHIPVKENGLGVIDPWFVSSMHLNHAEVERAEDAVLRNIAILPES